MMQETILLLTASSALLGLTVFMFVAWLFSLKLQDASIVDRLWGLNFLLLCVLYCSFAPQLYWRNVLVLGLVCIWSVRLSRHIHLRNRGHGEDYRYQAMRQKHGGSFWWYSFFSVFLLQGGLSFLISAPLLWVSLSQKTQASFFDALAILFWGLGFYFETVGDRQLKKFKSDLTNKGKILDQGLWALTRHPNYFGDALIWWAFFLFALAVPNGWMTFLGPVLMTFFLRYVSGVRLLEKSLSTSKPGYNDYISKTPAFMPRPKDVYVSLCRALTNKKKPRV